MKIVCEASATSHPYLVSFPFYTIPICLLFKFRRIFYLLVILVNKVMMVSKVIIVGKVMMVGMVMVIGKVRDGGR